MEGNERTFQGSLYRLGGKLSFLLVVPELGTIASIPAFKSLGTRLKAAGGKTVDWRNARQQGLRTLKTALLQDEAPYWATPVAFNNSPLPCYGKPEKVQRQFLLKQLFGK